MERRSLLKTVAAAAAAPLFAAGVLKETAQAAETETNEAFFGNANGIEFDPLRPSPTGTQDFINVPSNYNVSLVIRWGDPVVPGAPEFDGNSQTAAKQALQFGYNNDYLGFFPGTDWKSQNSGLGILAVNHEYTNEELMFRNSVERTRPVSRSTWALPLMARRSSKCSGCPTPGFTTRTARSTAASPARRFVKSPDRFDVAKEPNEVFRFGWNVEIDPYNPNSVPKKRTAMGRCKHECATTILSRDNRCVVYSGDDERFD